MADPKPVGDSLALILERINLRAAEMPEPEPVDEVGAARAEAEEKHRQQMHKLCEVWGVPFSDAQQILRGKVDKSAAMEAATKWRNLHIPGGVLVLNGPNGCGKTFAASWIVMQGPPCPYPYGGRWPGDRHPRFIEASELMHVSLYGDAEWRALRSCSVLAIDDVGTEFDDDKGSFQVKLGALIAHREKGPGWTVLTTNTRLKPDPKDRRRSSFVGTYGNRILSRLHGDGCGFVHIDEDDRRRKT